MGKGEKSYKSSARRRSNKPKPNAVGGGVQQETMEDTHVSDAHYYTVAEPNSEVLSVSKKDQTMKEMKNKKLLSKRKRKQLVKMKEKMQKSLKRTELLASLANYQVSEEELSAYQSASKLGRRALKGKQFDVKAVSDVTSTVATQKKWVKERSRSTRQCQIGSNRMQQECDATGIASRLGESESKKTEEGSHFQVQEGFCASSTPIPKRGEKRIPKSDGNILKRNDLHLKEAIRDSSIFVEVKRTQEIQVARVLLPILAEEQLIMETIKENDVVVLSGETGSGKTTQVPQFLFEAGYSTHSAHPGMIGITEPRRVAAVSMSKRVATEMNVDSCVVSYQIRYEGNVKDTTKIKFMTDGVLLKELEKDFLLKEYSVLLIDEAHERSVFTDILIGLLSRVLPLRKKRGLALKLIIMSATLKLEDFVENRKLFPTPPPVLKIDSRQYPVTIHYNKKTPGDYVAEAYKKVCKIHRMLNSGGILVFLTGKNEVHALCSRLRKTFTAGLRKKDVKQSKRKKMVMVERALVNLDSYPELPINRGPHEKIWSHEDGYYESGGYDVTDDDDNDDVDDDDDDDDDNNDESNDDNDAYDKCMQSAPPLHVLPLYSLLPIEKQSHVFEPCPDGSRLCVVSTNVAETSLTIPGIKYVVDCGKVKRKCYDRLTGVSCFRISWTSKASANQRSGRAGRLEPGHCYRLFSSAVFQNDFEDHSPPEILHRPADELLLLMKDMGIDKVTNFPFPTSPSGEALLAAEQHLVDLNALKEKTTQEGLSNTVITELGKTMAKLPVSPKYAKMMLMALQGNCLQYIIAIVAALTVKEIFSYDLKLDSSSSKIDIHSDKESRIRRKKSLITQARRRWSGKGAESLLGDMMVILRAVGAYEFASNPEQFCKDNGLRYNAMVEIKKLRSQLCKAVNDLNEAVRVSLEVKLSPPSAAQITCIRQLLVSCLGGQVARKFDESDMKDNSLRGAYQSCSTDRATFIHPESSMFDKFPEYVVYQEIVETSKLYMKGVTAIEEDWLAFFAPYKCSFSEPLGSPQPYYDPVIGKIKCYMRCCYGPHSWNLPLQQLDYPDCIERKRWFAVSFLEGEVSEELKIYAPHLLAPPRIMTRHWSKMHLRTEAILRALVTEGVSDRTSLFGVWRINKRFLLEPYLQWIPEFLHMEIRDIWPPSS